MAIVAMLVAACGHSADGSQPDAAADARAADAPADAAALPKNIKHVIVIVQENHTFDSYFGGYCTAPTGSAPTCTTGPACCETAPATDPTGASPTVLDDTENGSYDPNHNESCEVGEVDSGRMDGFVTGTSCSDARNFAIASAETVAPYTTLASTYALADRYFQPLIGASSSNDMYLATAHFVFLDDEDKPTTNGAGCTLPATGLRITGTQTIADLLIAANKSFAFYSEGYAAMVAATLCPLPPSDCPEHIPTVPCDYDPSDNPFEYYSQFADNMTYMKDYGTLASDIAGGTLRDVSFVKPLQYHNEHPGFGTLISTGAAFVNNIITSVLATPYADDTLILVTWDEGGGFFDHVAPPPTSTVDNQPYGTRVPLLAIGKFAKQNYISHVTMEHSSIVRFLEWDFLGATGQLGNRDAQVHDIGDLLDPTTTLTPTD